MAIFSSPLGPQAGLQMLTNVIQQQVSEGRSLTIADQLVGSFLWSVNISKNYMSKSPVQASSVMREQAVGLITNLKT